MLTREELLSELSWVRKSKNSPYDGTVIGSHGNLMAHDAEQRARIAELEEENARMRGIINRRCEEIEAKILEKAIKDLEADQNV